MPVLVDRRGEPTWLGVVVLTVAMVVLGPDHVLAVVERAKKKTPAPCKGPGPAAQAASGLPSEPGYRHRAGTHHRERERRAPIKPQEGLDTNPLASHVTTGREVTMRVEDDWGTRKPNRRNGGRSTREDGARSSGTEGAWLCVTCRADACRHKDTGRGLPCTVPGCRCAGRASAPTCRGCESEPATEGGDLCDRCHLALRVLRAGGRPSVVVEAAEAGEPLNPPCFVHELRVENRTGLASLKVEAFVVRGEARAVAVVRVGVAS